MNNCPLWFFWGQSSMTFLRWLTLYSAKRIHDDVRLIIRPTPQRPSVGWIERQDFQYGPPRVDWMPKVAPLGVKIINIEDVAPHVASLGAPDIQTADLLRLFIMAHFGGTTCDTDVVFLKPLPKIEHDVQLVVFSGHPKPHYIPIGFMQGRPCTEWQRIFETASDSYDPSVYESCGEKNFPRDIVPQLSDRVIFPWAGQHSWHLWKKWLFESKTWPAIPDDCIGIHWCASHAQQWNQAFAGPGDVKRGAMAWAVKEVDATTWSAPPPLHKARPLGDAHATIVSVTSCLR